MDLVLSKHLNCLVALFLCRFLPICMSTCTDLPVQFSIASSSVTISNAQAA